MGYDLDTYFIEKPHETSPRRLYSQTGADWQYRVDFDRLRSDRLQRTREQMDAMDLGALVLYAGANIRYVTGSYQGNWKYNINIRYVVLTNGGEPILFETAGSDMHCARIDHRSALDAGPCPPGDYLAVGRRRRSAHGRQNGRQRCRGPQGGRGRKRKNRN
jgi:hypothetical protein